MKKIYFLSILVLVGFSVLVRPSTSTAEENSLPASGDVRSDGAQNVERLPEFDHAMTVVSVSRRRERIADAPAAVTAIHEEEIARRSGHQQIPKLLEFTAGVEVAQATLYDFNLNVRGFNSGLNRRVLVLIDGRDPSMPFLSSQEWAATAVPPYLIESAELVRGPSSALYGSNAVNGVLNLTTKNPRGTRGGRLGIQAGSLENRRFDLSASSSFGKDWFFRVTGGYEHSEDFTVSRNETVEYEGALPEVVPVSRDDIDLAFGSFRLDKDLQFGDETVNMTAEVGMGSSKGQIFVGGAGRFQFTEVERPWGRFHLSTKRWNLNASHETRNNDGIVILNTGESPVLNSSRTQADFQWHRGFFEDKARLVTGASYTRTVVDSADETGRQTAFFDKEQEDKVGIYTQLDYEFSNRIKGVLAIRWEDSDFYDTEVSPKAGLVFGLHPNHRLRLTYNKAFQPPSFIEFFTEVGIGQPSNFSDIENELAELLGGVSLGLDSIPLLAIGNPNLTVEEIETIEVGYHGVWGKNFLVTMDAYESEIQGFVSPLLPQLGTSLGRLNPDFGPYQPPEGLTPEATAAVLSALQDRLGPQNFAILSNDFSGQPVLAAFSFANVGEVETRGFELAGRFAVGNFEIHFNYAHFDFDIEEETVESPILPNAPENKFALGLSYVGSNFDISADYRWSEDFDWRSGILVGPVPSYGVVDLATNYVLNDHWKLGATAVNLLNDVHYEIFGGDLLERRFTLQLSYSW